MAAAGASFVRRLHQQASLSEAPADGGQPVEVARVLRTVPGPLMEPPISRGAKAPVAACLIAARVPEAIVPARRRRAKEQAQKKGDTPSNASLALLAWHLLISNVPQTMWQTATGLKAYPIRWQREML
jgi:hypothetical protein